MTIISQTLQTVNGNYLDRTLKVMMSPFHSNEQSMRKYNPNKTASKTQATKCVSAQQQLVPKTLSQRNEAPLYSSKSAEYGANQQWNRLCEYWNALVKTGKVFLKAPELFEPVIFDTISPQMLSQPMENLLFQVSHVQRAHLLSIYIEQLIPTAKDF